MDTLILHTGADIPFMPAQLVIHQPTIEELSMIGEDTFRSASQLLVFSKDMLKEKDKKDLINLSDFEVLMSIIEKNNDSRMSFSLLLGLLFPMKEVILLKDMIVLQGEGGESGFINKETFPKLREILTEVFCLNKTADGTPDYNPGNARAAAMAERFKKARERVARQKGQSGEGSSALGRLMSVLSVGMKMDINIFKKYTIFQLYDANVRFHKWEDFESYFRVKLAGGDPKREMDQWEEDIHKKNK